MKIKVISLFVVLVLVFSAVLTLQSYAALTNADRVEDIIASMTLKEKITQMMMVSFTSWDTNTSDSRYGVAVTEMNSQISAAVSKYKFGAVIYFAANLTATEQAFNLTRDFQAAAIKDGGIPMLICADQEGGNVYRLGSGTALPGNMALGAAGDESYAEAAGRIIGSELSALGINTTLAPVVDVNNNANNPVIGLRSFGDDATAVGKLASATISGLNEYNVIGCVKHFPGHGDTATDSHYGLPMVNKSLNELKQNELKPYEVAIADGVDMIMTAHILYPELESDKILSSKTGAKESLPATMSDNILSGLLKEQMGFSGIITTDAMNMKGITSKWNVSQAIVTAIKAGVDMICMPCELANNADLKDLDAIITAIENAVSSKEIPIERINDAVRRILTVKERRGILDYKASSLSLERAKATVGSEDNRALEREIAAAAVTVIKNESSVLPLKLTKASRVLMLVPNSNESAQMIIAWERAREAGLVPESAAVDYYVFSASTVSGNSGLSSKLSWADTVIVNSEVGGAAKMAYKDTASALPNNVANYCRQNNKKCIVSSVDKPYDVQLYPNADAIVAAYGCKGSSVDPTEALLGNITSSSAYGPNIIAAVEVILGTYGARGKLPLDIPKYSTASSNYTSEIAYARGYGITYRSRLIDTEELDAAIAEAGRINKKEYSSESISRLQAAVQKGKNMLDNSVYSPLDQKKLESAKAEIINAIDNLSLHIHGNGTKHEGYKATCTKEGRLDCYVCSCGAKFLDEACEVPLNDVLELNIPPTHSVKYTSLGDEGHYGQCTECGYSTDSCAHEIKNGSCTVCDYSLKLGFEPDEEEPNNVIIIVAVGVGAVLAVGCVLGLIIAKKRGRKN